MTKKRLTRMTAARMAVVALIATTTLAAAADPAPVEGTAEHSAFVQWIIDTIDKFFPKKPAASQSAKSSPVQQSLLTPGYPVYVFDSFEYDANGRVKRVQVQTMTDVDPVTTNSDTNFQYDGANNLTQRSVSVPP